MPIPEHAFRVTYRVHCMDDSANPPVDVSFAIETYLSTGPEIADGAARAAAEGAIAYLREHAPHVPASAYRSYALADPGDPWPEPAETPPATES